MAQTTNTPSDPFAKMTERQVKYWLRKSNAYFTEAIQQFNKHDYAQAYLGMHSAMLCAHHVFELAGLRDETPIPEAEKG